jgi:hypothetical protein
MARTSIEHREIQAKLESRMLSGEPFIYGRLAAWAEAAFGFCEADTRLVDKTIQKLRRRGAIGFVRRGHDVVWTKTSMIQTSAPAKAVAA